MPKTPAHSHLFSKVINPCTSPFLSVMLMTKSSLDLFCIFKVNHDFELQHAHTQLSCFKRRRGTFLTLFYIYIYIYIYIYPHAYLLTPWSRVLLEKLTGSAASQEIPRIFGTRRFLTVLTSARHLSLSSANSIQSPQPPPTS